MNLFNARWHFVNPQRRCEISALMAGRWRLSEKRLHPHVIWKHSLGSSAAAFSDRMHFLCFVQGFNLSNNNRTKAHFSKKKKHPNGHTQLEEIKSKSGPFL